MSHDYVGDIARAIDTYNPFHDDREGLGPDAQYNALGLNPSAKNPVVPPKSLTAAALTTQTTHDNAKPEVTSNTTVPNSLYSPSKQANLWHASPPAYLFQANHNADLYKPTQAADLYDPNYSTMPKLAPEDEKILGLTKWQFVFLMFLLVILGCAIVYFLINRFKLLNSPEEVVNQAIPQAPASFNPRTSSYLEADMMAQSGEQPGEQPGESMMSGMQNTFLDTTGEPSSYGRPLNESDGFDATVANM